jgi:hypothetical protein
MIEPATAAAKPTPVAVQTAGAAKGAARAQSCRSAHKGGLFSYVATDWVLRPRRRSRRQFTISVMATDPIREWQQQLTRTFELTDDPMGGRTAVLTAAEQIHRQQAGPKCHGFAVLMEALQEFSLETFRLSIATAPPPDPIGYSIAVATFRRFRACLNNFWEGHCLEAAAGLRSILENVLFLSGTIHGFASLPEWIGTVEDVDLTNTTGDELAAIRKEHRDDNMRKIVKHLTQSLSKSEKHDLQFMRRLLHGHVHHAESQVDILTLQTQNEKKWPAPFPTYSEREANIFTNNAVCFGWAFSRVLPYQPNPKYFEAPWQHQWRVLDSSFRFYLNQMADRLSHGPLASFLRFMDTGLAFPDAMAILNADKTPESPE